MRIADEGREMKHVHIFVCSIRMAQRGHWTNLCQLAKNATKNIFGNARAAAAVAVRFAGAREEVVTNTTKCSWVNVDIDVDFGVAALPVRAIKSGSQ